MRGFLDKMCLQWGQLHSASVRVPAITVGIYTTWSVYIVWAFVPVLRHEANDKLTASLLVQSFLWQINEERGLLKDEWMGGYTFSDNGNLLGY